MSELRNRKGGDDGEDRKVISETPLKQPATIKYTEGKYDELYMSGGANFKRQELEDIIRMSVNTKGAGSKLKSMSNATKAIKDQLDDDPYNMELIYALGGRYFSEFEWGYCSNTMLRGWKRVKELKTEKEQFSFLMKLCEASYRNHQFKQAHAVYMDIQEPDAGYERKAYLLLGCQVFAEVKNAQMCLASFSKVVESEGFEDAIPLWAACALALRKVGVFQQTATTMNQKVRSGPTHHMDQERMKTVESWSVMGTDSEEKEESALKLTMEGKPPKKVIQGVVAVLVLLLVWMFYVLEQRSLRRHNLTK